MGGAPMSFGKFQFTIKTWIIIIIIAVIVISVATAAIISINDPAKKPSKLSPIISVMVLNNMGINQIDVTNENTGETFTFTKMSLPNQFNCSLSDYLVFRVTVADGYTWNAWWFSPMDIWCRGENNVMQLFAS